MKKTYIAPTLEIIMSENESVLFTTSIPFGGEGDGDHPVTSKQDRGFADFDDEEDDSDPSGWGNCGSSGLVWE